MTREEAIEYFKMKVSAREAIGNDIGTDYEAYKIALSSLRPVSREQVEQVWRGYWDHKEVISNKSIIGKFFLPSCECFLCGCYVQQEANFCPHCGAPMTDEAVQMVMERLEALKDES